jgi:hypothetical protein
VNPTVADPFFLLYLFRGPDQAASRQVVYEAERVILA